MKQSIVARFALVLLFMVGVLFTTTPTVVFADTEDDVPEAVGSITVCKILVDAQNTVVDGSALATTTFMIPGTGIPATVFALPLVLNAQILSTSSGNDAACVTYGDLPITSYMYGAEQINGASDLFETPAYNDQYTTMVNSVTDFFSFQGGDENADGSIILNPNVKDRTVVVLNKLKPVAPVDVCSNIDGAQPSAPEGMHIDGTQCVEDAPVCSEGTHFDTETEECVADENGGGENETDVCENIDGPQESVPEGYEAEGDVCTLIVVTPQCSDGIDNDNDGLKDDKDPGCYPNQNPGDTESYNPNDNDETHVPETPDTGSGGGGGGGNGPVNFGFVNGGGNGGGTSGGGLVLGASTTTLPELPSSCSALLKTYMRMGRKNDVEEVKKLQQFLNDHMGTHLIVSGLFGLDTDEAVRAFQKKYEPQVLTPWGIKESTGYVFKTTQRWINMINCSSLNIPMPQL